MTENIVRFTKSDRSSFPYWFAHWCAFNMTALNLKCWKFKYLFHDIEKPWLRLFWEYSKVQKWHRSHNNHHIDYLIINDNDQCDWEAMIIDWECSRFTKQQCPRNAAEEYERMFNEFEDFVMRYTPNDNIICNYIKQHDLNTEHCATIFQHAYQQLHFAFKRLGIDHKYRTDYMLRYFNKNC